MASIHADSEHHASPAEMIHTHVSFHFKRKIIGYCMILQRLPEVFEYACGDKGMRGEWHSSITCSRGIHARIPNAVKFTDDACRLSTSARSFPEWNRNDTVFVWQFLAEWGDRSQIATIALVSPCTPAPLHPCTLVTVSVVYAMSLHPCTSVRSGLCHHTWNYFTWLWMWCIVIMLRSLSACMPCKKQRYLACFRVVCD